MAITKKQAEAGTNMDHILKAEQSIDETLPERWMKRKPNEVLISLAGYTLSPFDMVELAQRYRDLGWNVRIMDTSLFFS